MIFFSSFLEDYKRVRNSRSLVLAMRSRDFVVAARALGASRRRILIRHLLPNVAGPVIVSATLGVANVIALEAGLSYIGLGVQPPTPSWGSMIREGMEGVTELWWITLFPALAIVLTVLAFNVLGDALRDALAARQVDARPPR